jgi:hypothetical protein
MVFCMGKLAVDGAGQPPAGFRGNHRRPAGLFGTLAVADGTADSVELTLLVTEDGTFSNFDSLGSFSTYSPARP